MLFSTVPSIFDVVAACIFIAAALEGWIAVILTKPRNQTCNLARERAVLFSIVPSIFDIVAACIFIAAALEGWIAVIPTKS